MSEAAAAGSAPAHAGVRPGTVAKYVFVDSPELTPADLALRAYEIAPAVQIKETCFGLVVTGPEQEVERLVAEIRKFDPERIFVKDRGFPPGDERRCRANLGGARPGFYGHENEMRTIRYISAGLRALSDPKKADLLRAKPKPRDEPLSPERLAEIIEEC